MGWWLFLQVVIFILLTWMMINNIMRRFFLHKSVYSNLSIDDLKKLPN